MRFSQSPALNPRGRFLALAAVLWQALSMTLFVLTTQALVVIPA